MQLNNDECRFTTEYHGHILLLATAVYLLSGHTIDQTDDSIKAAIQYIVSDGREGVLPYLASTQAWRSFKKNQLPFNEDTLRTHVLAISGLVLAEAGGITGLQQILSEIQRDTIEVSLQHLVATASKPGEPGHGEAELPARTRNDAVDALVHLFGSFVNKDGKPNVECKVVEVKVGPDGIEFEGGDLPPHVLAALKRVIDKKVKS